MQSSVSTDIIVIGAGIAGASAAAGISLNQRVILLEMESQPGYHATGRSAALFSEIYGNSAIRALSTASRPYFLDDANWSDGVPLLGPRGSMIIAREDQMAQLDAMAVSINSDRARLISAAEACNLCPALRANYVAQALHEPDACDVDVSALHSVYLRRLKQRGGVTMLAHKVTRIEQRGGLWYIDTGEACFSAPVLVNAAGAWGDEIAQLASVQPVGLQPMRRTAFTVDPPQGLVPDSWPTVIDVEEQFYFKPEGGRVLISPADETPQPPSDVHPEEIDIAIGVDRVEAAAKLDIRHIRHRWAGLRTFVSDRTPVVGFDDKASGFFWLVGQGGYGVQTAPALAQIAAMLIEGQALSGYVEDAGIDVATLSPERLNRISAQEQTQVLQSRNV